MKKILLSILLLGIVLAAVARLRYGGGEHFPDRSTPPVLPETALEEVFAYPEPIGNVATGPDGRLFFTVHPEARPRGNRLLEIVDGAAVPYPDGRSQPDLFDTVLGIAVDRQNRLWAIDHGNHGLRDTRLMAFDLDTGDILRNQVLPPDIAPAGSYLKDLAVSPDGRTIVIADASFWRRAPALVVYDVTRGTARRVLDAHESVSAGDFVARYKGRDLAWLGGLVSLQGGVDGIALDVDWLYFGALSGTTLYRVAVADLEDAALGAEELATRVEAYAPKPLGSSVGLDSDGNLILTDVEHHAVYIVGFDRSPRTLVQSHRIRWPEDVSVGPGGWLYVADSALPELVLKSREHIAAQRPYRIFRFRPGAGRMPGT